MAPLNQGPPGFTPLQRARPDAEARNVERAVERFQRRAPGLKGIVYDMALRGKTRECLYDLGLHTITKCPKLRKGEARCKSLSRKAMRSATGAQMKREIFAVDGAACVSVMASGQQTYLRLERIRTLHRENKRLHNGRRYRFYNEYRVPNDHRVEPRLRGARLTIRVDDPNFRDAPFSLAENLHAIAPGEDDWERLFDLRNPTESLNALIKSRFSGPKQRAPAVGAARQHFAPLGAALYINFQAAIAHAERLEPRIAA